MQNATPPRRLRRRWKVLLSLVVLALLVVLSLPSVLSMGFARARVSQAINQAFAPGKVQFDTIELSWFRPTRLAKVVLFDPQEKVVARVPVAVLDQSLFQLILPGRVPIVLDLDDAALEVERAESGLIDLAEALQTIIAHPDPKRDLTIKITHGTLEYRDPFLAQPSTADAVDLTLRIPTAPNPVTWSLKLERKESTLEVQGDFDRWLSRGGPPKTPELQVRVESKAWPFVAKAAEVDASGRLDGSLEFARKRGQWVLTGDARLSNLRAKGKPFAEDTLAIDHLEAGWDFLQGDEGWAIRRLAIKSPLADLKAEGQITGANGTGKQKIEGKVDLAAIARQLPHALKLREGLSVEQGSARFSLDLTSTADASTYDIEAKVSDLLARDHDRNLTLREPATLTGLLIRNGKDSSVERLGLKTSFLDVSANGRFKDGVKLQGTIDLEGCKRQLGEWVDLGGVEMAGKVELSGTYRVLQAGTIVPYSESMVENVGRIPTVGSPLPLMADLFTHRIQASVKDLRLVGFSVGPVRRDSLLLNLSVNGPVDSSGLPRAWEAIYLRLKDGHSEGQVRLDPAGDGRTLISARVSVPIKSGDPARSARLSMEGDWSSERRILSFAELSLAETGSKLAILATGEFNLASGEIFLQSRPERRSDALMIGPEGVRVSGLGKGLNALRFEGNLSGDAAALDRLVSDLAGRSPIGLTGRWSAQGSAKSEAEGVRLLAKASLTDPTTLPEQATRPTWMALSAAYSSKFDRLEISEIGISTAYGTLDASGKLDEPMGGRRVLLNGRLSPDFAAITALLVKKVEPGAKVEGRPRSFQVSGAFDESSGGWDGLDAEVGFEILAADIYGMKFGATPVVLHAKNGKLGFDPISTSINEGHIRLEPELDLDAPGGAVLRLAKNSNIRDAKINDEVSKRVLAYVAPILDQATRASGLVSVDLDHAEFPLGLGRGRQAKVEGAVVFQDVEFAPGPLAAEILGAIGRRDLSLKLDQPVTLTIADGRINQRGMSVPVGDFTRIELSGWVDFDRNLGLMATVPVTPAMLGNNPLLSDIVSGAKVKLPISGTLDKPEIDREAFSKELQELGKTLLTRGATRGAMELLMRLTRPKDPDAPPPAPRLTPDERKAQRQEKRAIRRGEIPPPNPGDPKP